MNLNKQPKKKKKRKQKEGGALQINGMTKCSYAIVNKLMKIINLRSIRPELELEDKYANAEKNRLRSRHCSNIQIYTYVQRAQAQDKTLQPNI